MKIFRLLIAIFFALPFAMYANPSKFGAMDNIKLNSYYTNSNYKNFTTLSSKSIQYPFYSKNGEVRLKLFIKYSDDSVLDKLVNIGGKVVVKTETIASVDIPAVNLSKLVENPNISRLELSKKIKVNNDEGLKDIKANLAHTGKGLNAEYKGEGVIVGVLDTGIDFKHPDFWDNGNTRLLSIFDLSEDYNPNIAPNSYDYGRIYSKETIQNNMSLVLQKDFHGHGTHVAGTAAGNGSGNPLMTGVAPKSDIIFVKGVTKESESFPDEHIVLGCQYIFDEANKLGKPAVINLSLGGIIGPHDGSTLYEQALSELVTPGNIIVAAAGNDGQLPLHAGGESVDGQPLAIIMTPYNVCDIFEDFCPDIPNMYLTAGDMWYETGTVDSVFFAYLAFGQQGEITIATQAGVAVGEAFENRPIVLGDQTLGLLTVNAMNSVDANNGDGQISFQLHNGGDENIVLEGTIWMIVFKGKSNVKADVWTGIPLPKGSFTPPNLPYTFEWGNILQTIGSPATAMKTLAIASHTTKTNWTDIDGNAQANGATLGERSTFSSVGPTRDGRNGVHVSAPGEIVFSALSSDIEEANLSRNLIAMGGLYQGMQGTSMATPHATGAIALMLQVKPDLSFEEIETILNNTSRKFEGQTGIHPAFGAGKLDVLAALKALGATGIESEDVAANTNIYPIPATNEVNLEFSAVSLPQSLEIYSYLGEKISSIDLNELRTHKDWHFLNVATSNLNSGLYFFKIESNGNYASVPFLINK